MPKQNFIIGKDFKAFMNDPSYWPNGSYCDDESLILNGTLHGENGKALFDHNEIGDATSVVINSGDFYCAGRRQHSLQEHYDSWDRVNRDVTFEVTVGRHDVEKVKMAIHATQVNAIIS